jgi:hypothetical protein
MPRTFRGVSQAENVHAATMGILQLSYRGPPWGCAGRSLRYSTRSAGAQRSTGTSTDAPPFQLSLGFPARPI